MHRPARKLGEVLQQLAQGQQLSTAALLVQRLVSGEHPDLASAAAASGELDAAAAAALGPPVTRLQAADSDRALLLALLLTGGDGGASLLSSGSQAAVLGGLLEQLHAAAAPTGAGGSGAAEADVTVVPVLSVLQSALLSPALDASPSGEVQALRLQLATSAFGLLLSEAAAEAEEAEAAAAGGDSSDEHAPSAFLDDSDAESAEVHLQPGAACTAARQLWQQSSPMRSLIAHAPVSQQSAFLLAAQGLVESALAAHPSSAAAAAAADATVLLLDALGRDSELARQLLRGFLLGQQGAGDEAAAGTSSLAARRRYSAVQARLLLALGAAAGFESLLPANDPASAAAAVDLLAALQLEAGSGDCQHQRQLLQHVASPAGADLLQQALQVAAAAGTGSSPHAAALCALLQAAVDAGAASTAAAAAFFAAATRGSQQQLPPALLQQVLPIVAPAFRASSTLLEQSGLAELSQQLCQQAAAAETPAVAPAAARGAELPPALQLLRAAVACFPCYTGAEAAAQLPLPAVASSFAADQQPQQQQAAAAASYAKGDAVWYRQRDGTWLDAEAS